MRAWSHRTYPRSRHTLARMNSTLITVLAVLAILALVIFIVRGRL